MKTYRTEFGVQKEVKVLNKDLAQDLLDARGNTLKTGLIYFEKNGMAGQIVEVMTLKEAEKHFNRSLFIRLLEKLNLSIN